MSTNYELHRYGPCPECGQGSISTVLHIGKSTAGWVFCWHGIPAGASPSGVELKDAESWQEFLTQEIDKGAEILSEGRMVVTLDEFFEVVDAYRGQKRQGRVYGGSFRETGSGDEVLYGEWH